MRSLWPRGLYALSVAALAIGVSAQLCFPTTVELVPAVEVGSWPDLSFRWRDVATNPYAPSYMDSYTYEDATVAVTFAASGESVFTGHISATGLKPNFAYQMKLEGKPEALWGEDGDNLTNERLGYAGRWWEVQPNPGNRDDSYYQLHSDDSLYIFEGYLAYDLLVTDQLGNAERDFTLKSSYHVLWWEHQRTPQACDSPVEWVSVSGSASDPAYADDFGPTAVGVYGEIERLCYGETVLLRGDYNCRLLLTEETFHQSGGPSNPGWVSVNGNQFWRDGGRFHYAGTNCYYLMVYSADESLRPYVDEVLEETKALGMNVIRTWAFNDGSDEWNALQLLPGVYDESVFQGLDYVIYRAGQLGLHVILPFVNNWDDYGGMNQYVEWSSTASSHDDFFSDVSCRQWYEDHIETVLSRVNTFNGIVYQDDPTVFAWELANEPRANSDTSGDLLQGWIEEMAGYIKSIDSLHLVTTGSEGFYGPTGPAHNPVGWFGNVGVDFTRNHQPATVDFACFHVWPDWWGLNYSQSIDWAADHVDDSDALLGKPVILEEYGKQRPLSTRDQHYQGWYDVMYGRAASGSAAGGSNFWILYHDDYTDYDGFGVYYPADSSTIAIIATEAVKIRDLSEPVPGEGNWSAAVVCDTMYFELSSGPSPGVSDVLIENLTLLHTGDYIKDGDAARVTATVTDDDPGFGRGNIVADLTGLGGGSADTADSYVAGAATWMSSISNVNCSPSDGIVTVMVTATNPIGNSGNESDTITADNTAPAPITGFSAEPHHRRVALSWDDPSSLDLNYYGVIVRYHGAGDYPEYATMGTYPADKDDGDEAFSGAAGSADHNIVPRDVYYYTAFAYDWALNHGPAASSAQDRSINYWLGEVEDSSGFLGNYDGYVDWFDMSGLSSAYWLYDTGNPPPELHNECDVGPTDDGTRTGIPVPDDSVNINDLVIFSRNYGVVNPLGSGPSVIELSGAVSSGKPRLTVIIPEDIPDAGGRLEATLQIEGNEKAVSALSLVLTFDPKRLGVPRITACEAISRSSRVFMKSMAKEPGELWLDLAVLGTGSVIHGSGEIARVIFPITGEGEVDISFAGARLFDAEGRPLEVDTEGVTVNPGDATPLLTRLLGVEPNPFRPSTRIRYSLRERTHMALDVYDTRGRLLRTLVSKLTGPGRYHETWDGRDRSGCLVPSGVYFVRMKTDNYTADAKIVRIE